MPKSWWNRAEYERRRPNLKIRALVLTALRRYFGDQGFFEVETPALQVCPGIDRHIQPLKTSLRGAFESHSAVRFLHTSPEFSMKKLLAAGEQKIFQICHVYRDGEDGALHHPEFTLLEWYRAGKTYEALINDVQGLVMAAAEAANVNEMRQGHLRADPTGPWLRMTVAEAFQKFAGLNLMAAGGDDLEPAPGPFIATARAAGVRCDDGDRWDDVFNRVMLDRVEPALASGPPALLTEFPSPVGALARTKPGDPSVCERVEAYICGIELANGFSELSDPDEQRSRFDRDRAAYEALYGEGPPIDDDFIAALGEMPDAAGMALGIDRLVMLLTGAPQIRDVLWAPVEIGS